MLPFERGQPDLGTEDDVVRERILAIVVDTVGLLIVTGIPTDIAVRNSVALGTLVAALGVVLFFGYFIYFEAEYGQTPGKMFFDVIVVTEKGGPLTYRDAAVRSVLRIPDYLVGLPAILLTDRNQRIGDMVADTIVVHSFEKGDKL